MSNQIITTSEIAWFDPGVKPPPFNMRLLLMVAGSRSNDCGATYELYTKVITASVQITGPGDDDGVSTIAEFEAGDEGFLDFQFDLKDEDEGILDWHSDSIIAWAYYPLGAAQAAFKIDKARQSAAKEHAR